MVKLTHLTTKEPIYINWSKVVSMWREEGFTYIAYDFDRIIDEGLTTNQGWESRKIHRVAFEKVTETPEQIEEILRESMARMLR